MFKCIYCFDATKFSGSAFYGPMKAWQPVENPPILVLVTILPQVEMLSLFVACTQANSQASNQLKRIIESSNETRDFTHRGLAVSVIMEYTCWGVLLWPTKQGMK